MTWRDIKMLSAVLLPAIYLVGLFWYGNNLYPNKHNQPHTWERATIIMFVLNTICFSLLREPFNLENILSAVLFSLIFSPIFVNAVRLVLWQREWVDSWKKKRGMRT